MSLIKQNKMSETGATMRLTAEKLRAAGSSKAKNLILATILAPFSRQMKPATRATL